MAELGEADEAELQRLVAAEQQKAQFTAQVRGQGPGGRDKRVRHRFEFSDFLLSPCGDSHWEKTSRALRPHHGETAQRSLLPRPVLPRKETADSGD